jgi:hypothetical protein
MENGVYPKDVDCNELRNQLIPLLSKEYKETLADWASVPDHWTARKQACERKIRRLRKMMTELHVLAEFAEEIRQVG